MKIFFYKKNLYITLLIVLVISLLVAFFYFPYILDKSIIKNDFFLKLIKYPPKEISYIKIFMIEKNNNKTLIYNITNYNDISLFMNALKSSFPWNPNHPIPEDEYLIEIKTNENIIYKFTCETLTNNKDNIYITTEFLTQNVFYENKMLYNWFKENIFIIQ